MHRFTIGTPFAVLLLACCAVGCDSPANPADASAPSDAQIDAARSTDAGGADGSSLDASVPPGEALATSLCVPASVAISADATRVAYVSCEGGTPSMVVGTALGVVTSLGASAAQTPIVFAPDGAHVAWRGPSAVQLRDVGGSEAATSIGLGDVEDFRFATQTSTGQLRLLVLDRRGAGAAEILAYDRNAAIAAGYDAPRALVSGADIRGDLELITSGAVNVLYEVELGGGVARYGMAQLDGAAVTTMLDVDPNTLVMGVIGLGNTHGIARRGDGLSFVQFSDASIVELSASGLPAGDEYPIFVVEDAAMNRYAYFLVDGDPSRRLRNGTGPLETLASGSGTGMTLSHAQDRLYYVSGAELRAVTLDGATDAIVMAALGAPTAFAVALSSDDALVASLGAGSSLRRAGTDGGDEIELETGGVDGDSIGWASDDSRLYWLAGGRLRGAGAAETSARTMATDVVAWWPLPDSAAILYLTGDGTLRRLL